MSDYEDWDFGGSTFLFSENYGWEHIGDIERDVLESLDVDFNKEAECLKGEFDGEIHVRITYIPNKDK